MLVCGQINPPPITAPEYVGMYFSTKDDLPAKVKSLSGIPLRVEHNGTIQVGHVLQGWTDSATGSAWALAEIDVSSVPGAVTAAAISQGAFGEFSLGYSSKVRRNPDTGRLEASDKHIVELSVVKHGARPGCKIAAHSVTAPRTRSIINKQP